MVDAHIFWVAFIKIGSDALSLAEPKQHDQSKTNAAAINAISLRLAEAEAPEAKINIVTGVNDTFTFVVNPEEENHVEEHPSKTYAIILAGQIVL